MDSSITYFVIILLLSGLFLVFTSKNQRKIYLITYLVIFLLTVIIELIGLTDLFNLKVYFLMFILSVPLVLYFLYLNVAQMFDDRKYIIKASLTVLTSFLYIIFIYGNLYLLLQKYYNIKGDFNLLDAIYYSIVTITTCGYGDIYPIHTIGRVIASSEMLLGYFFSSLIVAIIVSKILEIRKGKSSGD